jgi:hypothetical protein
MPLLQARRSLVNSACTVQVASDTVSAWNVRMLLFDGISSLLDYSEERDRMLAAQIGMGWSDTDQDRIRHHCRERW